MTEILPTQFFLKSPFPFKRWSQMIAFQAINQAMSPWQWMWARERQRRVWEEGAGRVHACAKAGNFHHFKISENHLMAYNLFVSIPCHVTIPHSSLRLEEIAYPRGAEEFHSLAHQTTLILNVFMHIRLKITSWIRRKNKEKRQINQIRKKDKSRYRWKRRI